MSEDMQPTKDARGVRGVAAEDFLIPYVFSMKPASPKQLGSWLVTYLSRERTADALSRLEKRGILEVSAGKVLMTEEGNKLAGARFGKELDRKKRENVTWPAMALGLDTGDDETNRIRTPALLAAVTLVIMYDLPLDPKTVTLNQVACAFAARGLAGLSTRPTTSSSLESLVRGDVLGAPEKLRSLLIKAALVLSADDEGSSTDDGKVRAEFAKRVNDTARELTTPPFSDAVAIAQIYDAYGRKFADAGGLESFKRRLLEAHQDRMITLLTLDRPEAMDRELRGRSVVKGTRWEFHLVKRTGGK